MTSLPNTRRFIQQGIEEGTQIGAQWYVSVDGRTMADEAAGESQPGVGMRPNTLMIWLSAGKPISAVAIGQLWERGLLDVDDPVSRFIPEFGVNGKERITLRHLLTHTAGIRGTQSAWPEGTWDSIIAALCRMRVEPEWVIGRKAGYHAATSWFILGEVIQRISGLPFGDFVRQNIFEPCGMKNCLATLGDSTVDYGDRLGVMWNTKSSGGRPADFETPQRHALLSPGASLRGPIRELARFYESLLGKKKDLLQSTTIEALTARHRTGLYDHTFKAIVDWGLGFILNSWFYGNDDLPYSYGAHASRRTFGHSGSQSSVAFADPEHRLVAAVCFNGMCGEAKHIVRQRRVCDAIYEDLGLTSP